MYKKYNMYSVGFYKVFEYLNILIKQNEHIHVFIKF